MDMSAKDERPRQLIMWQTNMYQSQLNRTNWSYVGLKTARNENINTEAREVLRIQSSSKWQNHNSTVWRNANKSNHRRISTGALAAHQATTKQVITTTEICKYWLHSATLPLHPLRNDCVGTDHKTKRQSTQRQASITLPYARPGGLAPIAVLLT